MSTDGPNLSLGQPPKGLTNRQRVTVRGAPVFLLLQLLVLAGLVWLVWRPAARPGPVAGGAADSAALRRIAIELEDRSLYGRAARAWEAYLAADPETENRGEILYRIGKLYFQADRFEEAADALVRAQLAAGDNAQLRRKIGPRLVDCLRRLGLYGEVGRELSRQVEVGGQRTGKGKVLATLAGEPITDADLDRMIERRVDQMLELQGGPANEAAREEILHQLSAPAMRQQLLREMIQTELFARRARELHMDREEAFLQARRQMEQQLLAARFLARELASIRPTELDLQSYLKANADQYKEPESAEVLVVELAGNEDWKAVLEKIRSAGDFRKLAAERQQPGGTAAAQADTSKRPKTHHVVRGRIDPLLGDTESLFELQAGQWTERPLEHAGKRFLVLVEAKQPARVPPLEEIRARVLSDYLNRKQQELTEQLMQDLMRRYEVKLFSPAVQPAEKENHQGEEAKK